MGFKSKKGPATYGDFDFFFLKKGLLPMGILIFFLKIPPILKIEVGFFSDRKTFAQNVFPGKFYYFGTNYERSFKRFAEPFFSQKNPGFWNLKSDFFLLKKSFLQIFQNTAS